MWQQELKIRSEGLDVTFLIKLDGETNYGRGVPSTATVFGPGGPIAAPQIVRSDYPHRKKMDRIKFFSFSLITSFFKQKRS